MGKQFQYIRLDYQEVAAQSLVDIFADVSFVASTRTEANPLFDLQSSEEILNANINDVRERNDVSAGDVGINIESTLNLDVLMETGTGKTFTFIETIYKLHKQYKLAKFIILAPSNPIRQGTIKSLASTSTFFSKEYNNQKISVFNYSPKTIEQFIHNSNAGISVLVATYQSFNKDKNTINKRGVEANLFGRAKSYMEALAEIRPVIIIDEPHRFEGAKTVEYISKFNPLFTMRFGATFKNDEFENLVYTLDSKEAFRRKLVKSITVDEAGDVSGADYAMTYTSTSGTGNDKEAHIHYKTLDGKSADVELKVKDNFGEKTGIQYLSGYVIENITKKEVIFTNGFTLSLGEQSSYGMLADDIQRIIIQTTVRNHFEREEALFKRGIKSLSLFFIDSVAKYLPVEDKPAVVRELFESIYKVELALILNKTDLDNTYRDYLERTSQNVSAVHKGYFSRSRSEKSEEEAVKLILEEKEKLLSFDTDLRFIFSMWALQEGWDNPNVFTLCKLAPSNSKITKLQQIGRGLRLAVNQNLERILSDDSDFDLINELVVVVPAVEKDYAKSIQGEIDEHSVNKAARRFNDATLVDFGVAPTTRIANKVLDELFSIGTILLDDVTGFATINIERQEFDEAKQKILLVISKVSGANSLKMVEYFEKSFGVKVKRKSEKIPDKLTVNSVQYAKFKDLWENINRDSVLKYDLDTPTLVTKIVAKIKDNFDVKPLSVSVTKTINVEDVEQASSTKLVYAVTPHSVFSLVEFVRELSNATKLSYSTVAKVLKTIPSDKFAMIALNEGRALAKLKDMFIWTIYELIINKVSYNVREVQVKTSLTDSAGALLESISLSSCGKDIYNITNRAVSNKSIFNEDYMGVDSQIEKDTIDESNIENITVFAKLPRIKIPTPLGDYNPDFGYVIHRENQNTLYLVLETKGYDSGTDIGKREEYKILSAKHFFEELTKQGFDVKFETKLNQDKLADIITSI